MTSASLRVKIANSSISRVDSQTPVDGQHDLPMGNGAETSSVTCIAVSNVRCWWQEGQVQRDLHEKATNISCCQLQQRTRAYPSCRSRRLATSIAVSHGHRLLEDRPRLTIAGLIVIVGDPLDGGSPTGTHRRGIQDFSAVCDDV